MALSVAEQLLVLISRSDGSANGYGRKLDVLVKLDVALAGALLSELVADGYAALVDKKVQATAARRDQPEHPRLRAALAIVARNLARLKLRCGRWQSVVSAKASVGIWSVRGS